jgi:hypothetical protein
MVNGLGTLLIVGVEPFFWNKKKNLQPVDLFRKSLLQFAHQIIQFFFAIVWSLYLHTYVRTDTN